MSETLISPDTDLGTNTPDNGELEAMFAAQNPEEEVMAQFEPSTNPELSPTASLLRHATDRVANALEKRAVNKAHGRALKEYKLRDEPDYTDHLESLTESDEAEPEAKEWAQSTLDSDRRKLDNKEMLGNAKDKVQSFGRAALLVTLGTGIALDKAAGRGVKKSYEMTKDTASSFNDKTGDLMMAGGEKLNQGMDTAGNAIDNGRKKVIETYQTYKFNQDMKSTERQSQKQSTKELKAIDKATKLENKALDKQEKNESKEATREDRRFERSMRKKAALERRAERRERWSDRWNKLKANGTKGIEAVKKTYESTADKTKDFSERAQKEARIALTAGKIALETYKNEKESLKNN